MSKKRTKARKVRIKFKMILISLVFILLFSFIIHYLLNKPITNIYIVGNTLLHDQEIIKQAGIEDYPSSFRNSSSVIERRLEKHIFIQSATVRKRALTRVHIQVVENFPIFYNKLTNKTVLKDGTELDEFISNSILANEFPEELYIALIRNMGQVPYNVRRKISEIKYDPDNVDLERILLTMTDGNYVYLAMSKFDLIHDYNEIIKQFDGRRGILHLNAGGFFEVKK